MQRTIQFLLFTTVLSFFLLLGNFRTELSKISFFRTVLATEFRRLSSRLSGQTDLQNNSLCCEFRFEFLRCGVSNLPVFSASSTKFFKFCFRPFRPSLPFPLRGGHLSVSPHLVNQFFEDFLLSSRTGCRSFTSVLRGVETTTLACGVNQVFEVF